LPGNRAKAGLEIHTLPPTVRERVVPLGGRRRHGRGQFAAQRVHEPAGDESQKGQSDSVCVIIAPPGKAGAVGTFSIRTRQQKRAGGSTICAFSSATSILRSFRFELDEDRPLPVQRRRGRSLSRTIVDLRITTGLESTRSLSRHRQRGGHSGAFSGRASDIKGRVREPFAFLVGRSNMRHPMMMECLQPKHVMKDPEARRFSHPEVATKHFA
jgi:hypothetical protein